MNEFIPFFSFKNAPIELKEKWYSAARNVIIDGVFINGPRVKEFESSWAKLIGVNYTVGVGNGLDGLVLALEALEIGHGDQVAVPAHTFIASWTAIRRVGATPVGVDVTPEGLIDFEKLKDLPTTPKAVMPVHMHGKMCDMNKIQSWASKNGVLVIEDASQAHLAKTEAGYAGSIGDVGVFSLYPSKNLGGLGDAGIVATNSLNLALKIKQLSNYGSSNDDKYRHLLIGANSRLDEMQAAFLLESIQELGNWNDRRREIATIYDEALVSGSLQTHTQGHVYHHYAIRSDNRINLINFLKSKGIGFEIHYPHLAANEYYDLTNQIKQDFPVAQDIANSILSLPLHQWLSNKDVEYIQSVIREASTLKLIRVANC